MTKFVQKGKQFRTFDETSFSPMEKLPVGTYTIGQDLEGWLLTQIENYKIGKIYGNVEKQAERIRHTFNSRPSGTGLLLSGEKGSGKTTLAKLLSVQLQEEDVPTIVINQPWAGESFNKLIQSIQQPAVVIFDEFEKVYHDKNDQNAMLTLLDGVYPAKKLFILTTNDRWGISEHMRNRPGRLFYHLEYKGLEEQFVVDYCQDNLNNKTNMQGVVNMIELFEHFNFDMLKAVFEEMNRFNETAKEALKMMNVRAESWTQRFKVEAFDAETGEALELHERHQSKEVMADPSEGLQLYYYRKGVPERFISEDGTRVNEVLKNMQDRERFKREISFDEEDMVSAKGGTYKYVKDGVMVVLTKVKWNKVSYESMAMAA